MPARATIGIPFFDHAAYLPAAIRSVFAQSETDWELLLLDDGSTDGSLEIARAVRDPRVRVLSDGANHGIGDRLNQAAALASAEILIRMDADDVMHPRRLELQLAALAADPAADLVCSPAWVIDEQGRITGRTGGEPISDDPAQFLFHDRVIVHPTLAVRRAWARANPYHAALGRLEDKELFARTHPRSKFVKLDEPLLFYRHVDRFSARRYANHRRNERRILRRLGPERVGRARTAGRLGSSLAKEWAYRALGAAGLADAVYERVAGRNVAPLSPAELERAGAVLTQGLSAPVPGW
jgi:glycosyltransferase involved in cell wall biosynthesis